ncbi:hypothetical protein BDV59DRAFT_206705 [Aspergillus ambiguus]|uniref:uncharacterized protein n=1 Tax=Aspergillus ambiguus TaxID=176160 RepID=UPI003CCD1644
MVIDTRPNGEYKSSRAPQQEINISIDPGTAQLAYLEDEEEEDLPKVHDLRLIEFAHTDWTPG